MSASDKTMFEIYREKEYNRRYKVVYFTELTEHNKETEINRALLGEHFLDGFIFDRMKEEAKGVINDLIQRLNAGEEISVDDAKERLEKYLA